MTDPTDCKFAATHEWIRNTNGRPVVGVSDDIQHQLSDIIHVELPEPDEHHHYAAGEEMGVIESLKMSIDFHAPVAGFITAINSDLLINPEFINTDPYGSGWLVEMQPDRATDIEDLMDIDEYEAGLPEEEEEE